MGRHSNTLSHCRSPTHSDLIRVYRWSQSEVSNRLTSPQRPGFGPSLLFLLGLPFRR